MNKFFKTLALAAGLVFFVPPPAFAADDAPLTVVELFTSQGCSSCPPADKFLGELAQRHDLLALSVHVDYWDYIGWKDNFASPENTMRQRRYAQKLGLRLRLYAADGDPGGFRFNRVGPRQGPEKKSPRRKKWTAWR